MARKRTVIGSSKVAVALIRASKDEQQISPDAQRASIEAWAAREGVQVAAWHVEHVCSTTDLEERAGLMAALADLTVHGAGILIVAKRDRLSRDPMLTMMLERMVTKNGATVVSAAGEGNGSTPADAFMRTIIDGAAAYELANIRARTKAALASKKSKGERVGTVPFGYRVGLDGVHLEPDEREQGVIGRVTALATGGMGSTGIARVLESEGVASRSGKPLAQPTVWLLMQRAKMVA